MMFIYWLNKNIKTNIIDTCCLSDEITEHVLLMKIDILLLEYNCLLGAEKLIDKYGIDMMIVEFVGQRNILEFLHKKKLSNI